MLGDQAAMAAARNAAEEMLSGLDAEGATLAGLAEAAGLEFVTVEAANRRSVQPDAVVVQELFRLPDPGGDAPLHRVVDAEGGFALVELLGVTDGSVSPGEEALRQMYGRQVANAAASAESRAILRQLRDSARIDVFEDRLR
ncbi:MAG: hypothetical protein GWM87_00680 [Xanthomonadales bacterium]|nr:hypothetical protein [Xanthomonadales bacterium]NIQ95685.1 hypothetical protein [Desulfuromonadales bacterium]NIX11618.1 hypothetical protein [Xanthomonadales bacterium]